MLVLAPTRELAIQVAEAFGRYAKHLSRFHVLPVYGGADMRSQIRQLQRGVHVVVGTPGRVMDHMRRKTLKLDNLEALVLDEADEMLRMGFIDDVKWVLGQTPETRQIALFSATMPKPIVQIAKKYLKDPQEITIKVQTRTADTINQRYCFVPGPDKISMLTRILEAEEHEGVLVFVRTKHSTKTIADKLSARGYSSEALSGDVPQRKRERTVEQLKSGRIDIVVATDVAARGLDVDRISHVINFDIPHDTESYIHRIGRTGRAGRKGEAVLFVAPRERHLLSAIERSTKQKMSLLKLSTQDKPRIKLDKGLLNSVKAVLEKNNLQPEHQLLEQLQQEIGCNPKQLSAALLRMANGETPLVEEKIVSQKQEAPIKTKNDDIPFKKKEFVKKKTIGMQRFRVEVGLRDGVKAKNLISIISQEAGIEESHVVPVVVEQNYSIVELPEGMPKELMIHLKRLEIAGRMLKLSPVGGKKGRHQPQKSRDTRDTRGKSRFASPKKIKKKAKRSR